MTDPIADFLTRIRNANHALLPTVELPHSRLKESIARMLKQEGYLADYSAEGADLKKLKLKLKFQGRKGVIEGLRRVSTPGIAPICRRRRDSARAGRTGRGDPLHAAGRDDRDRGAPAERRRRGVVLRLVTGSCHMSRIGRLPVAIPPQVKVEIQGRTLPVEGPKGKLQLDLPPRTQAALDGRAHPGRRAKARTPRRRRCTA